MIKKNTRQLILDSAEKQFAQNGYQSTSVAQVAAGAGIGKSTIYEYFKSKEEIFVTLLEQSCHTMTLLEDAKLLDPSLSAREKITDLLTGIAREQILNNDMASMAAEFWAASQTWPQKEILHSHLRNIYSRFSSQAIEILRQAEASGEIRTGVNHDRFSIGLTCLLDGMFIRVLVDQDLDLEKIVNEFVEIIFMGLKPEQGRTK